MRQTETHFTQFWRSVDARLSAEAERPATVAEIAANAPRFCAFGTVESTVASIIFNRVALARANVKAA